MMVGRSARSVPGQSDIKKLRRENELLRREIWGLRDECDRLEELLKRKEQEEEEQVSRHDFKQWLIPRMHRVTK